MVIAGRFVEPLYFRAIVAGSMMVVFDFALEPAAIAVMPIPDEGLGEAINDRLRRAAAPRPHAIGEP